MDLTPEQISQIITIGLKPIYQRVRTDVTAVKTKKGSSAWTEDKLSTKLLQKHLNGGPARGVSFIQAGSSHTRMAGADLDSHKGETSWVEMVAVAKSIIVMAARMYSIRLHAFRSTGGRGIHLLAMWDTDQDAHSVRMALDSVLAACGLKNGANGVHNKQVEIFPKQDSVAQDGYGNMMYLPLAGQSVPLDEFLMPMEKIDITDADLWQWQSSEPVPFVEAPVVDPSTADNLASLALLESALAAIPNDEASDLDYDGYRDIAFAVANATNRSIEGYKLFEAFSKRSPKHDQAFLDAKMWPSAKVRPGGKGAGTIFRLAREKGLWQHPHETAGDDDFDDLGGNDEVTPADSGSSDVIDVVAQPIVSNSVATFQPFTSASSGGEDKNFGVRLRHDGVEGIPNLTRNPRGTNEILSTAYNVAAILSRPEFLGFKLALDDYRDAIIFAKAGTEDWKVFRDSLYTWIQIKLETHPAFAFKAGLDAIKAGVLAVAEENRFHSGQRWGRALKWDGVPRVKKFLRDVVGTVDTPYTDAVSLYMWTALAGRMMQPGIKADMIPVFYGGQGARKSTLVSKLVPDIEAFAKISLKSDDDKNVRLIKGTSAVEIDELQGMEGRDSESIRSFITQPADKIVKKYEETTSIYYRSCVMFGTTNKERYLTDSAGHRRFLPVSVAILHPIDIEKLEREREQLWAEAIAIFDASGIDWTAENLARQAHEAHEEVDPWYDAIAKLMSDPVTAMRVASSHELEDEEADPLNSDAEVPSEPLTMANIARVALNLELKQIKRPEQRRIADILLKLGYSVRKKKVKGVALNVWEKTASETHPLLLDQVPSGSVEKKEDGTGVS